MAETLLATIMEHNGHRNNNKMNSLNEICARYIGAILNSTLDPNVPEGWISCTKNGPLHPSGCDGISWTGELRCNLDGQFKSADICNLSPGSLIEADILEDGRPKITVSADLIGKTLLIPDVALALPHLRGIARIAGPGRRHDGSIGMSISRPRGGGTLISLHEDLQQKETLFLDGGGILKIGVFSRKMIHETKMPISSTGKNLHNITESLSGLIEKAKRCGHCAGGIVFLRWRSPICEIRDGRRIVKAVETVGPHTLDAYRAALGDSPSLLIVYEDRLCGNREDAIIEQVITDLESDADRSAFCAPFASDLRIHLLSPSEVASRIHSTCPRSARRAEDILSFYGPDSFARKIRLCGHELL